MLKCFFENSYEASLRHAVVDVLILDGKKILLVKRTGKLLEGGKWALPGGFVERDETTKVAAAREVLEETGYQMKELTLLTLRDNPDRPSEDRQNIAFVYYGTASQKIANSDNEVDDQQWFFLSELPPKDTIAFDHYQNIELYLHFLENKQALPILK